MVLCAMKPCSSFKCGTSSSSMLMSGSQSITTTQSSVIGDTCCQRCTGELYKYLYIIIAAVA